MGSYLVTGGAGFIGSHIAEALVDRGDTVRIIDNFDTGRRENLADFEDGVQVIEADINDADALNKALDGVEVVFHEAALPSVPRSIDDPVASNRANVDGTLAVLWAAQRNGVRRVVYAASSSAYGDSPHFPRVEDLRPDPLSPYAVSKLAGEYYCHAFTECYGLETVALRYFNVFGPRQDPKSQYAAAIPLFITALLKDEPPTVYGDGEQSRDFTYIDNVVKANLCAAEASAATAGKVFNVACGTSVTVNAVIAQINRLLDKSVPAQHVAPRPGDVRHSNADISQAKALLGYEPVVDFETGLERTVAFFKPAG